MALEINERPKTPVKLVSCKKNEIIYDEELNSDI
jgi:hypothetical protein